MGLRSKSLQKRDFWYPGAQLQFWILTLTLITGCIFFSVARYLSDPVASEEVYGVFITVAHAEAWALPLIIGPLLAIVGVLGELSDDIPVRLCQIWRALGNFITGGVEGLFAYGAFFAPTFEPLFIYSAVFTVLHTTLFIMAIDDMTWERRYG